MAGNEHCSTVAARDASWIVVDRATGAAVVELFTERAASAINTERYEVVPALAWLQQLNKAR